MGDTGRLRRAQHRRRSGGLIGVLAFVAVAVTACGSATDVDPLSGAVDADSPNGQGAAASGVEDGTATTPEPGSSGEQASTDTASDPETPLPSEPGGDAGRWTAALAASVEFDSDAFAEIKPGGPRDVDPRRFRQLIDRDRIVPVYDPLIVSADQTGFTPDELVLGVALNGESRAYAVGMMRSREIANDELGGVPLLVTW